METMRRRHLEYYLKIALEAAPELIGPRQFAALESLQPDYYNFRYALDSSLEVEGLAPSGLQLAVALGRFWEIRSMLVEGRELLASILAHPANAGRTPARAAGLGLAGRLAWLADRIEEGAADTTESMAIYRELGDEQGIAAIGLDLALYKMDTRQFYEAKALTAEVEEIAVRLKDKRLLAGVRRVQGMEATVEQRHRDALASWEESLALFKELGDIWFQGILQWAVGVASTVLGDYENARARFRECLNGAWALGNRWAVAYPLEAFAALAVAEGAFDRAARLLGAAEALRSEFGMSTETTDHPALRQIFASAAPELVKPARAAARKEGRGLTAAEAVAFALETEPPVAKAA
jgi:non-specific serine/threonine protein kinase